VQQISSPKELVPEGKEKPGRALGAGINIREDPGQSNIRHPRPDPQKTHVHKARSHALLELEDFPCFGSCERSLICEFPLFCLNFWKYKYESPDQNFDLQQNSPSEFIPTGSHGSARKSGLWSHGIARRIKVMVCQSLWELEGRHYGSDSKAIQPARLRSVLIA
jgi:hypothetical protein